MQREKTAQISEEEIKSQLDCCEELRHLLDYKLGERLACVDTYGCQQNEADSERLRGFLSQMGYGFTDKEEEADVVILNTCAIREHAENRVMGNVGALVHSKRRKTSQVICVCGCMAQEEHVVEKLKNSFRHIDLVFGPHMLWKFPELLKEVLVEEKRVFETDDVDNIAEGIPVVRQDSVKAWVSIMYGCNNFCTYCIVPYVRGRERSREPQRIIEEVKMLIAEGYKDITLLGQNVNSYGKDLPEPMAFSALLETLAELEGEFLLRFMTSHPKDANEELFDVMARCPKIAAQMHLPFQSGSSRVLSAMNRGYTREKYLGQIKALRERIPHITLTSDVIVGFPGETQEEFEETMTLIEEVGFEALFTFQFSARKGTPAYDLADPMPKEQKSANFQRLLSRQNEISRERHFSLIGKTLSCLVEGENGKGGLAARTEGGRLVYMDGDISLRGQYVDLEIYDATTWALFGR